MEKFVILADITCDLSREIREHIGMQDYIMGHVSITEGENTKDYQTDLDWQTISRETFYGALDKKNIKVVSAPPNLDEYMDAFTKYVKQGYAVLSMSISSKISGTYDFSCVAAKKVQEQYPEAQIYCFDSLRMAGAFGLLVLYAHLLQNEGKSFEEVITWLEANKNRVHQMGPIDDLIVIARRGRITMGKAILGSFAGVKPMGDCNREGYVTVLTRVKGIRKALDLTAAYVQKTAVNPQNSYAIIEHTDRAQLAELLKDKLQALVPFKKVFIVECFAGNATNIGTGMTGVYYFGEDVSDNMQKETAILLELSGN
ncbi:MAG: DegV family EDD domain-containing protein [Clostridia bacterium]|nr:DegV family EDD domain-containing protein [Clostridia bacterium]